MPTFGRARLLRLTPIVALLVWLSAGQPLLAAPMGSTQSPAARPQVVNPTQIAQLTALGDSVPFGTACGCIPYPRLTMRDISHAGRHGATTKNDAVAGFTSDQVLAQVEYDRAVRRDIVHSQAVTIEVGANDVKHSAQCGNNVACYAGLLPKVQQNLDGTIYCIWLLTQGHPVTLVLLDYWNVWLGGKYAAAHGSAYVNASNQVTEEVSNLIQSVARSAHAYWIDLQTAFRGPDHDADETQFLAPDGDHPNSAGHQRISQAIEQTIGMHA
jgi:lysophospholipase L1-like esterase